MADLELRRRAQEKTDEEAKRNRNFVQLNIPLGIPALRQAVRANPLAMELLLIFMWKMDSTNAVACSHKELIKITGKSSPSIYRAVKWLRDNQYITVSKLASMNVYNLSPFMVWKAWANAKKHAAMKEAPVLDRENDKLLTATRTKKLSVLMG